MQTKRTDALKGLKDLVEELKKSQENPSGRTHQDDFGKTYASWLPDINKWIEAINSKVRKQLIRS